MTNTTIQVVYPELLKNIKQDLEIVKENVTTLFDENKNNIVKAINNNDKKLVDELISISFILKDFLDNAISLYDKCPEPVEPIELLYEDSLDHTEYEVLELGKIDTGLKPIFFKLKGQTFISDSWRDLTKQLLIELFNENPRIFSGFIYNPLVNGTKVPYFAHGPENMIVPVELSNSARRVFVDIDKLLLNNKRMLKTVLEIYGLPSSDLLIAVANHNSKAVC